MLTVIIPASHQRLTTLATAKRDLGITDTSGDVYLLDLIEWASAIASTYTGRVFAAETVSETFRLNRHTGDLRLERFPVVSVTSVIEGDRALSATEYEVDTQNGILRRLNANGRYICLPPVVVTVEYVGGYILDAPGRTVPADLEAAVLHLVRAEWFARFRDPAVKSEDVSGVGATTYWISGDAIPATVESLLAPYRQPPLG